ncbi:SHOCT domain-containing protein [Winogradskyella sp. A2]|uniref:SHOCT domain-containing protein n=1 Tax=Winogradskyella sp. A2 TaxID=3366944 RepID=UPI00398C2B89
MEKREFDYCIVNNDENRLLIEYYDNKGSQSIQRNDIGEISSFYNVYLKRQPLQYGLRALGLGFAIIIIGLIIAAAVGGFGIFITWIGIILAIVTILSLLIEAYVDPLLGTNYGLKMCNSIFGIESYKMTVKHENGNEAIHLYVSPDEKEEFLKYINSLKKESVMNKLADKNNESNRDGNDMEDIEKLAELHKKGIITDKEFAAKKKQILGI